MPPAPSCRRAASLRLRGGGDASSESEPEEEEEDDSEEEEEPAKEEQGELTLTSVGAWNASEVPNWDAMLEKRMAAVHMQEDVVKMHPTAYNAGAKYAKHRATPLAPRDGWYDERYVCATNSQLEMDEETDFEYLVGAPLDGIVPPKRVSLAMKGVQDYTVEMIARFLDETSLRYGDTIKAWREEDPPQGVVTLFLNDNPITDAGAAFLADALKNNHTIEELYLHYTFVNDKGLAHLLEMLGQNKTLKKLELGNSGITEGGIQAIFKAFDKGGVCAKNNTLEHLGLFGNADNTVDDLPAVTDLLEPDARKKRGGK